MEDDRLAFRIGPVECFVSPEFISKVLRLGQAQHPSPQQAQVEIQALLAHRDQLLEEMKKTNDRLKELGYEPSS